MANQPIVGFGGGQVITWGLNRPHVVYVSLGARWSPPAGVEAGRPARVVASSLVKSAVSANKTPGEVFASSLPVPAAAITPKPVLVAGAGTAVPSVVTSPLPTSLFGITMKYFTQALVGTTSWVLGGATTSLGDGATTETWGIVLSPSWLGGMGTVAGSPGLVIGAGSGASSGNQVATSSVLLGAGASGPSGNQLPTIGIVTAAGTAGGSGNVLPTFGRVMAAVVARMSGAITPMWVQVVQAASDLLSAGAVAIEWNPVIDGGWAGPSGNTNTQSTVGMGASLPKMSGGISPTWGWAFLASCVQSAGQVALTLVVNVIGTVSSSGAIVRSVTAQLAGVMSTVAATLTSLEVVPIRILANTATPNATLVGFATRGISVGWGLGSGLLLPTTTKAIPAVASLGLPAAIVATWVPSLRGSTVPSDGTVTYSSINVMTVIGHTAVMAGTLAKNVTRGLAGSLARPAVSLARTWTEILSAIGYASLGSGTIGQSLTIKPRGSFTSSGAVTESVTKALAGSSRKPGATVASTWTAIIPASMSHVGGVSIGIRWTDVLAGSGAGPSGAINDQPTRVVTGHQINSGNINRSGTVSLPAGTRAASGNALARWIQLVVGGVTAPSGAMSSTPRLVISPRWRPPTGSQSLQATRVLGSVLDVPASVSVNRFHTLPIPAVGSVQRGAVVGTPRMGVLAGTVPGVVTVAKSATRAISAAPSLPAIAISSTITALVVGATRGASGIATYIYQVLPFVASMGFSPRLGARTGIGVNAATVVTASTHVGFPTRAINVLWAAVTTVINTTITIAPFDIQMAKPGTRVSEVLPRDLTGAAMALFSATISVGYAKSKPVISIVKNALRWRSSVNTKPPRVDNN